MKFDTTFSCGEMGWVYLDGAPQQLTIGQIRIEYTNSPGLFPDSIFDNYKGHPEELHEVYMCLETGIVSGKLLELGKHIFRTKAECIEANKERIAEEERNKAERAAWKRQQLLTQEDTVRAKLAEIEAAKAQVVSRETRPIHPARSNHATRSA